MVRTHPDFKSVDKKYQNAVMINSELREALSYQYMFERKTTPWEMSSWEGNDLNNFELKMEQVDRLYHLYYFDSDPGGRDFEFVGRMDYNDLKLYVELSACCDYTGFSDRGGGHIFVSTDANLFLKSILIGLRGKLGDDLIFESLEQDGIIVDAELKQEGGMQFYKQMQKHWTTAPSLKFLSHSSVYENKHLLEDQLTTLPKYFKESISEFIKAKDVIAWYDG